MQWFYPGLITHGSSSSILEHSNMITNYAYVPHIVLEDTCHIAFDNNAYSCSNIIVDLTTYLIQSTSDSYTFIIDTIILMSFVNFWMIGLIVFIQSWEILITQTQAFNTKHNVNFKLKNLLITFNKLRLNSSKLIATYYLY